MHTTSGHSFKEWSLTVTFLVSFSLAEDPKLSRNLASSSNDYTDGSGMQSGRIREAGSLSDHVEQSCHAGLRTPWLVSEREINLIL